MPFRDGHIIPVVGMERRIRHRGLRCRDARGAVWMEPGELHVIGEERHVPRRIADWLRGHARDDFARRARFMAADIRRQVKRVVVRDTKSRWGSCAVDGTLSFSWRLVLAPPMVLDYLAAHEVAHLREMNHSPPFWRLVRRICPHTDEAEAWLKAHGASLHAIGAAPASAP